MKRASADERKEKMKAAEWTDYGKIEVKEVATPVIGEDEVLLKVRAAGVCMTDVHVYSGKFAYGKPPHILGHEICGEIAELGKKVMGFEIGQRVVVETTIGCGECEFCKTGQGNFCEHRTEIGTAPHNGGYAQYVKAPAKNLTPVPDEVTDEEAAIMESINCPAGALMRRGVRFGETVVVYGVGPAGLAFIQTAKALGAGKVIAVARKRRRLEKSLMFGADAIVCSSEENVPQRIRELNGGEAPGLVCEATGVPYIIEEACEIVKNNGRIILYGLPNERDEIRYPVKSINMKQLEVYGAMENPQSWGPLLKLVAAGRINLKDMVTHTFPLDHITEAFAMLEDKKEDPIKIVVYPWA